MKKTLIIVLVVVLVVCTVTTVFCACTKVNKNTIINNNVASGGWGYDTDFATPTIPDDAQIVYDKVAKNDYKLVAYLGSQVVAGTNYAYLCVIDSKICVLTVYNDLNDKASILDKREIIATDYRADGDINFEELYGGWYCDDAVGAPLKDDVQKAFDDANQLDGISYDPLACIGTQVVGGFNYAILCKATLYEDSPSKLAVVVVFASADGENTIISQCPFEINP